MSELKCPFCQQEYIITKDDSCFGQRRCVCRNPNCEFDGWHFPVKLVSELIRTRKALDVAKKWLMKIGYLNMSDRGLGSEKMMTDWCKTVALHGLKEIETALEQKD